MIAKVLFGVLLVAHCLVLPQFSDFMRNRPVEVKLGYVPHPRFLKMTTVDQSLLVAELMTLKVLFYFGTLVEKFNENVIIRPEQANMFKTLLTSVQLDPYNMDAYYFSQASFTWEVGRVEEVNELLEWGAKHRTWDAMLPFYIGFNNAYFLKRYDVAAQYMELAAKISGNPLYTNLAARYFYESEQTEFGLLFLKSMIDAAKDKAVKQTYQLRYDSLVAVRDIEAAVEQFRSARGRAPENMEALIAAGFLSAVPVDPYGGEFFLDEEGRARTTSKLAPLKAEQ